MSDQIKRIIRGTITMLDAHEHRARASEWAAQHCTYQGGPVNFHGGHHEPRKH